MNSILGTGCDSFTLDHRPPPADRPRRVPFAIDNISDYPISDYPIYVTYRDIPKGKSKLSPVAPNPYHEAYKAQGMRVGEVRQAKVYLCRKCGQVVPQAEHGKGGPALYHPECKRAVRNERFKKLRMKKKQSAPRQMGDA